MNNNIPAYILALSQQLHTQDNRCTSHPIFQVRDVKQVPCLPENADDTHWWDADGYLVLDEELIKTLEEEGQWDSFESVLLEDEDGVHSARYTRTHTKTLRQVVEVFMTNEAAEFWVAQNEHRHNALEIYVASGFRNPEWQAIRDFLISLTEPPVWEKFPASYEAITTKPVTPE